MAGRIIYLEVDDEITSAAARIRTADPTRLAVVLPNGSRVATSRINFRLLSRDALTHEKRLSIVSGDPATRALAASAGLPVFSTVAEYESSLAGLEDEPRPGTATPVVAAGAVAGTAVAGAAATPSSTPAVGPAASAAVAASSVAAADGTLGLVDRDAPPGETIRTTLPRDAAVAGVAATSVVAPQAPVRPVTTTGSRDGARARTPWLVGGSFLALALLVSGVGVYLLLPSASIIVTPRPEAVGPIDIRVVADPAASSSSVDPPVVPARIVSIPVSVEDEFTATGSRVELTKATGTVRFENLDPTSTNRIASGSIVRTNSGERFRTDVTITVPKAELVGLTIFPARASVAVTAVQGGPDGNVEAGTIDNVPSGENGLFLKVTNPAATTGGAREDFTRVTQEDVDGAVASLNLALAEAFSQAMDDPALAAGGATVFPETGVLGESTPTVPPESLVGQEVTTFTLGLSATGTVVTADSAPVAAIAETQIRAAVEPGHELVAGSMTIEVGDAIVIGQAVSFPVTASAQQVAILDPAELEALVLGKPVDEARAILEPFGEVELTVSPDWSGTVPSFESRVDLTVSQAVEIELPAPSGSAGP